MTQMIRTVILLGFFGFVATNTVHSSILPEEIRLGALKHDVGSGLKHRYEKGYDINAELLWACPTGIGFEYILSPRPHLGASLNADGGTNQYYLGLTWRYDFLTCLFVEGAFGGEFNTGRKKHPHARKQALGSNFMFHEALSAGLQFTAHQSISAYLDHTSNAHLAKPNPGLTSFGVRYGYRF
jgi:lipid A 3-O-deacylase